MKKIISLFLLLFLSASCFALGPVKDTEVHYFDSEPMLDSFFNIPSHVSSRWDDVKISLITVSKGNELYSWFGHAGILVEDPKSIDAVYDYGRFSFSKDFYINFIKGQLWYRCGGFYAEPELKRFEDEGRTVSKIELDLTNEQKSAIVDFLQTNSTTPYNKYLYHHFNDNCSTRLRDIVNYATNGDFEKWAKEQKGYTFRAQTSRILHRNIPVEWVLDLLQGPSVDTKATLWDEMFLPENLEKAVLEYGKVTKSHSYIVDFRNTDTRPLNHEKPMEYVTHSVYAGLILGLLVVLFNFVCPKLYVVETSIINLFLAIAGSILFYMMFFSGHSFSWNNENILIVNFLLFIPLILGFKYKKHAKTLSIVYGVLSAVITVMIIIKLVQPQLLCQDNWPQLTALLPYYMANFAVCLMRSYAKNK